MGVALSATNFDLDSAPVLAALRAANMVESGFGMARCSTILHELHEAGIFDTVYKSEKDLSAALDNNPVLDRATLSFGASWLESYDPFVKPGTAREAARAGRPAVAAVAPVPGEPQLQFLYLTKWTAIVEEGNRLLPGRGNMVLARLVCLLSSRSRDATRREAASELRASAGTLAHYIGEWAGLGDDPPAANLARHVPHYLAASMSVMPYGLVGGCGTASACEAELRDAHAIQQGSEAQTASVFWARIHTNLPSFDVLS